MEWNGMGVLVMGVFCYVVCGVGLDWIGLDRIGWTLAWKRVFFM